MGVHRRCVIGRVWQFLIRVESGFASALITTSVYNIYHKKIHRNVRSTARYVHLHVRHLVGGVDVDHAETKEEHSSTERDYEVVMVMSCLREQRKHCKKGVPCFAEILVAT